MLQWFKSTLFSILFNIIFGEPPLKYPLKEQVEFNPAIYNIDLPSGVKYLVKIKVDSCKQKAKVEQKVTFHYILLLYDGKNLTHSGTSRTTKPVTNVLSITGKIPIGKFWQKAVQSNLGLNCRLLLKMCKYKDVTQVWVGRNPIFFKRDLA